jgi:CheY-like chemotaxis protein
MTTDHPVVLIVDDSENDVLLMRTAFKRAGFTHKLQSARDGDEAIAYLRGDGAYRDRVQFPLPDALLLDLKMPRKNGFEVLAWISAQAELEGLRVYVLTASNRIEDVQRARDLGANFYLVKPTSLDELEVLAHELLASLSPTHFAPLVETSGEHPGPPSRWFFTARRGAPHMTYATHDSAS